jgi:hypothetical protein
MPNDIRYTGCCAIKKNGDLYTPCCAKTKDSYCQSCTMDKEGNAKDLPYGSVEDREQNIADGKFTPVTYGTWLKKSKKTIDQVYDVLRENGISLVIPAEELETRDVPKNRKGRPAKSDDSAGSKSKGSKKSKAPEPEEEDGYSSAASSISTKSSQGSKGSKKSKKAEPEDEEPKAKKEKKSKKAEPEDEEPEPVKAKKEKKSKAEKAEKPKVEEKPKAEPEPEDELGAELEAEDMEEEMETETRIINGKKYMRTGESSVIYDGRGTVVGSVNDDGDWVDSAGEEMVDQEAEFSDDE